jgi:hypothetical protein
MWNKLEKGCKKLRKKSDVNFLRGKNRCMTIAYKQMYISHEKNKG